MTPEMMKDETLFRMDLVRSIEKLAEAINRLADAYLYVNQPEDEPGFEGQSLSDRESL